MYIDTVTIFNRYRSTLGDIWYPTVLKGVNLQIDKAAIIAKYGPESSDSAMLGIKYTLSDGKIMVGDKQYYLPTDWEYLPNDEHPDTITFRSGTNFDFFYAGEWKDENPISDNDFTNGYYNYMNSTYDNVFAISSVAKYSVIPHFEITGR